VTTQKLQVILQSKIPDQYCVCVAKLQKKDKSELQKIADRWQTGTTWRFKAIILQGDKPAYIHTPCRIAIDLRKSQAQALLQSTVFPQAPVPTVTIADLLKSCRSFSQRHCYRAWLLPVSDTHSACGRAMRRNGG